MNKHANMHVMILKTSYIFWMVVGERICYKKYGLYRNTKDQKMWQIVWSMYIAAVITNGEDIH